jgi:hypothetical protein
LTRRGVALLGLSSACLAGCTEQPGDAGDVCAVEFQADTVDVGVRTIGVQIPLDDGGSVHVDARWPATAAPEGDRWPVALLVHGAWDAAGTPLDRSSIRPDVAAGLVGLALDLPGNGRTDGDNDHRGSGSRAAVAAVLRWAAGEARDLGGCTLADRTLSADPDALYVIGASNGGNLAVATLADPALDLPPVAGLVTWETPASAQFVNVELGAARTFYEAGSCTFAPDDGITCAIPTDELIAPLAGGAPVVCFDQDGDGACGDADVVIKGVLDLASGLTMLSPTLLAAAEARGLDLPGYADLATANEWWAERDASRLATALVDAQPDLPVMLLASEEDHVQTLVDHPHVFGFGEGLQAAGARWTRLNPGTDWLPDAAGENAPDAPLTLADPTGVLLPEDVENPATGLLAAAIFELVDRYADGEW